MEFLSVHMTGSSSSIIREMASSGSQWEARLHPHQRQMSVFSHSTSSPTHEQSVERERL